jgi:hypothetical protein
MIEATWKAWAGFCGVVGAVALAGAAGLLAAGAFDGPRLAAAARVLRDGPPPPPAAPAPVEDESVRRQHEVSLAARRAELERLEARVDAGLARLRSERSASAEAPRTAGEPAAAGDAVLLDRLEPAAVVDVLRGGDDASFARALRGLRPSLAAEVLELLRSDPRYEAEFRRAGPSGKSRLDRVYGELRN